MKRSVARAVRLKPISRAVHVKRHRLSAEWHASVIQELRVYGVSRATWVTPGLKQAIEFRLEACLLCSLDYFILQIQDQVDEVVTVPCNPHYQVPVLFRMPLCITQHVGVYHVELDMMTV
jgi:hypothetical protein